MNFAELLFNYVNFFILISTITTSITFIDNKRWTCNQKITSVWKCKIVVQTIPTCLWEACYTNIHLYNMTNVQYNVMKYRAGKFHNYWSAPDYHKFDQTLVWKPAEQLRWRPTPHFTRFLYTFI